MMILYTIYDRATESHGQILMQQTNNAAVRMVKQEMANKDSMLAQHKTDYELWKVGEYDERTGEIMPMRERITRLEDIA